MIPSKSSDNDNGVHESTEASGNMTIQGRPTCKMEKIIAKKSLNQGKLTYWIVVGLISKRFKDACN